MLSTAISVTAPRIVLATLPRAARGDGILDSRRFNVVFIAVDDLRVEFET